MLGAVATFQFLFFLVLKLLPSRNFCLHYKTGMVMVLVVVKLLPMCDYFSIFCY